MHHVQRVFGSKSQHPAFDLFETGKICEVEFRETLKKLIAEQRTEANIASRTFTNEELDKAWNAMILELPVERIEMVRSLRSKVRTFLLSNTNSIHKSKVMDKVDASVGIRRFEAAFEKTYYSHEMGLRKPDPLIFKRVAEENQLNVSRVLFIDDSDQHVLGAREAGLKALHLDLKKYGSVQDLLAEQGII